MFDRWLIRHKAAALVSQLETCVWAAEESAANILLEELRSVVAGADVGDLVAARDNASQSHPSELVVDAAGVAHIRLAGPVFRETPFVASLLGIEVASTAAIGSQLDAANQDARVKSIQVTVDSPGGTVDGVPELAAKIRESGKPVHAHVVGQASSAAYWLASQADTLSAGAGASIGSIGVYQTVVDRSAAAQARGIQVHVVRSGDHKGVGVDGAAVTTSQLQNLQREIQDYADAFVADVAAGRQRNAAEITPLATGASWIASKARDLGLIDHISDNGAVPVSTNPAVGACAPSAPKEGAMMDEKTSEIIAAVEAKLSALAAKEAALDEKLAAADRASKELAAAQKNAEIEAGVLAGRIAPAQREAVEKMAANVGLEDLRVFISAMPSQVRPSTDGAISAQVEQVRESREEQKLREAFSLTREAWDQAGQYCAINSLGKIVSYNGQEVTESEES